MRAAWMREVLEPGFLSSLEGIAATRRRTERQGTGAPGRLPRASGLDWADHRPYEHGDDLRYLDWNLYARIGRPYVRRFLSERAERLDLLVDVSRSMTLGEPPKRDVACALGFILGYIALTAGERVAVHYVADRILDVLPARRGARHASHLLEFLAAAPAGGRTDLRAALGEFMAQAREVSRVVLLSDLLDETHEPGLAALRARGFEVDVVRLRCEAEESPHLTGGTMVVIDAETERRREIADPPARREAYRRARERESGRTAAFCAQAGVALARLSAGRPLAALVFGDLRRSGLLD